MTDLLTPVSRRLSAADQPAGRPLALGAVIAGLGAPAVALSLLWFVGLIGWYADQGGSNGTTLSVLRVAADGWLLAHGSPLQLRQVEVTASPLGVTLLCGYLTYRLACRAGAATDVDGLRSIGLGTVVLSGCYAAVALLTAVLAGMPSAEPGMGQAFLGGALVGAVCGGAGLLRGAGRAGELRRLVPVPALSAGYAAAVTGLIMVAAGALLTVVGLVAHWSAAVEVTDTLDLDLTGALLSLVLLAAIAPNVAVLASTYLLGSGFAVGTGTLVSPAEVTLGPVPSVPVLAALPDDGWAPAWAVGVLAVSVLAAAVAAFLVGRALPTGSYQRTAVRGLAGGVAAALGLTAAAAAAGGAIGPGRMADVGVAFGETLLAAAAPLAVGGLLGALVATWWNRRHDVDEARHREVPPVPLPRRTSPTPQDLGSEDTVTLRLPDRSTGSRTDKKEPRAR